MSFKVSVGCGELLKQGPDHPNYNAHNAHAGPRTPRLCPSISHCLTCAWPLYVCVCNSATQKKKNAHAFIAKFLVTELQSKEGKAPKRGLWGAAIHRTTPPPGWVIPRGMTGGGPVDTAVTSPCPLLPSFLPRSPGFPRTHMGPLLETAIKIKRLGVGSSHIVNLKADVKLRVVG